MYHIYAYRPKMQEHIPDKHRYVPLSPLLLNNQKVYIKILYIRIIFLYFLDIFYCRFFYLLLLYSMKKNLFAVLTVVFWATMLSLSGCGTSPSDDMGSASSEETASYNVAEKKEQTTSVTTMKALFASGKPVTCYFTMPTEDDAVFDGILRIDGKKMAYSMNGFIEGKSVDNFVIIKDWYSYGRSSMTPGNGYKMKETPEDETAGEDIDEEEWNKEITYTCHEGVDAYVFDLPGDITFVELQ